MRDPQGNVTSFDPPGSINTRPISINAAGVITGYYSEANGVVHGFVRFDNGTVVGFVPPGSTSTIFSSVELVSSINLKGDITGSYPDANNLVHGFLRHSNGTFVIFDVPGSTTTNAFSINDAGAITGNYLAADGRYRGFLHDPEGNFTSFDPGFYTLSAGINEDGAIAGYYSNGGLPIPSVNVRGFVRSPQGTITTFDPNDVEPTLCPLLSGIGTTQVFPTSIREGVITGYCFGSQGWVRHP